MLNFANHLCRAGILLCLIAIPGATVFAQKADQPSGTAALDILERSDATVFEKAKACQALAHSGNADAVPALATLLDHAELSNYARHALEGITHPAAAEALRSALDSVKGPQLVGVIASLGRKADATASPKLQKLLASQDDAVFAAAANAIAEIGNEESASMLLSAAAASSGQKRTPNKKADVTSRQAVLAQAALKSGQRLRLRGDTNHALHVFESLSDDKTLPEHISAAALADRCAILEGKALPILRQELQTESELRFQAVASALTDIAGKLSADELQQVLQGANDLGSDRRALLVASVTSALHSEERQSELPKQVRVWMSEPEPALQAACIRLLASSNTAEDVEALLNAACSPEPIVAEAAWAAIEECSDDRFDNGVLELLQANDAQKISAGIELAQRRRLTAATSRLKTLAADNNQPLRLQATTALGSTAAVDDLPDLLRLATSDRSQEARQAAQAGLRVAFVRLPQTASAQALANLWKTGTTEAKVYALERLGEVGGPIALATLEQAVLSQDAGMQDAGSRVLGEWMSPDAAPLLLKLAATLDDPKLKLRSLRGALRIARQLDMPVKDRISICQRASQLSTREEERKLIADIYRQYSLPAP